MRSGKAPGDPGEHRDPRLDAFVMAGDATVFDHSDWLAALEESSKAKRYQ